MFNYRIICFIVLTFLFSGFSPYFIDNALFAGGNDRGQERIIADKTGQARNSVSFELSKDTIKVVDVSIKEHFLIYITARVDGISKCDSIKLAKGTRLLGDILGQHLFLSTVNLKPGDTLKLYYSYEDERQGVSGKLILSSLNKDFFINGRSSHKFHFSFKKTEKSERVLDFSKRKWFYFCLYTGILVLIIVILFCVFWMPGIPEVIVLQDPWLKYLVYYFFPICVVVFIFSSIYWIYTPPEPSIATIKPGSATIEDIVTISGANFTKVTGVSFGKTKAANFVVNSNEQITAIVGPGSSGDVSITTLGGEATRSEFKYIKPPPLHGPIITSFLPSNATTGDKVAIKGKHLSSTIYVRFGNVVSKNFSIVSDSQITATVGPGSSGEISVTTLGGTTYYEGFKFVKPVPRPIITGFSPTSAKKGTKVIVKGKDFKGANAVAFGGVKATIFRVNSDGTQVTAIVGDGNSGKISITTSGGTVFRSGFNYISSEYHSKIEVPYVLGKKLVKAKSIINAAGLKCDFVKGSPATTKSQEDTIEAQKPGSGKKLKPGATVKLTFYSAYNKPIIKSFLPKSAKTGTKVTIKGKNFSDATGVRFGVTEAKKFKVKSDTKITATVGPGSSGNISVSTSRGTTHLAGFRFIGSPSKPIITAFSPHSAMMGNTVIINGENLDEVKKVYFGSTLAKITYNSEKEIRATVGNGSSGDVYIITPFGTASLSGFQYIPKHKDASVGGNRNTGIHSNNENQHQGQTHIHGHYEYKKKRKWVDTTRREKVWVEERIEDNRRIEGHYEHRRIPSGYWQEYEEKIWIPDHYE
jgi:hypothetical protein